MHKGPQSVDDDSFLEAGGGVEFGGLHHLFSAAAVLDGVDDEAVSG